MTTASYNLSQLGSQYNQGGTGAVARTTASKLQESVSVLDFGADPTGSTDSTAAFTNAVAASAHNALHVPKGTYKISSTINLPRSINMFGDGEDATIIQGYTLGSTTPMFYVYGDLVEISNMKFVGAASGSNAVGLKVYSGYTNTYRNLQFLNCTTGMQMDESGACLIDSCLFYNCVTGAICTGGSGYTFFMSHFGLGTVTGIHLDVSGTSGASTAVYVRQSFFASQVGIEMPTNLHSLFCDNSYFEGYSSVNMLRPFLVGQSGSGSYNYSLSITNCQIANNNCISSLIDNTLSVVVGSNFWGQPVVIGSTCGQVANYGDLYYLSTYWQNSCVQTIRMNLGNLTPYRMQTLWFDNYSGGESFAYLKNTAGAGYSVQTTRFTPLADGTQYLGDSSHRWNVVYAATGTINTSDGNEKQDVADLEAAEKAVATALKSIVKKFRYKDAVAVKGDGARIHVGVIAQDVEKAFTDNGLDATRYGVFCTDTWTDEQGQEQTRLGVRYEELLSFIIAAI